MDDKLSVDKLSVADVVGMVRGMSYKTGWTFDAYAKGPSEIYYSDTPAVTVHYEYVTEDSTPRHRGDMAINDGSFVVFPDSRERVQDQILYGLMMAEAHETSEFLRFNGHAPYHAHRVDGQERWDMARDYHGGIPSLPR